MRFVEPALARASPIREHTAELPPRLGEHRDKDIGEEACRCLGVAAGITFAQA